MKDIQESLMDQQLEEQINMNIFKEEAYERLAELEESMLELENLPKNPDIIDRAFRALHTIKGSGSMFGFDEIVRFTHDIETIFDFVRNGDILVDEKLIALTLSAHDQIKLMLEEENQSKPEDIVKRAELASSFNELLLVANPQSETEHENSTPTLILDEPTNEESSYRISFVPSSDIFANGTNPLLLLRELDELGECQVFANVSQIPLLNDIDPEKCYSNWDILLTTTQSIQSIEDVFIFVDETENKIKIEDIETIHFINKDDEPKKLGEILVERGDVGAEQMEAFINQQDLIGKKLESAGLADCSKIKSALAEQNVVKKIKKNIRSTETVSSIRVPSIKLDKLVDLVGELVTGQARLTQIANSKNDASLLSIAEEIERLTSELRDNTMSVRMLNFGTTFNKFKRLVRDLALNLGAEVALTTEGAETELDKNVIEKLNDPLVHIIRNSVDHGIEGPDVRIAAGKPSHGTIHLSAAYSGAHVLVRVSDDGVGLNVNAIRKKAVERGLIKHDSSLADKEIFSLIFEPGFSTAQTVTDVSGRGVGMDVVKQAIESLRGTVDIDSHEGQGTTITLKLPLTLAIIDGLLVSVGEGFFVIPLSAVEECIELTQENIDQAHGRHITNVRGQLVPYINMRDEFNITGEKPEIEQIVITEIEKHRVGFVVDHVIGQHQTVIKTLSKVYKNVDAVSGATIMADGTVALILDINKYFQTVERKYANTYN